MAQPGGKPKPAFFIAVVAVIAALVAFAVMRGSSKSKKSNGGGSGTAKVNIDDIKKQAGTTPTPAEMDDINSATTVKEYTFESAQKLPPVPGTSDYKSIGKERVVKFAINVWAGWAPIIYANEGLKAKKVWTDGKGQPFKLDLIIADNPVDMRNIVASGEVHIGWATVDMLPLLIEGLKVDPRTMPRVFHQVDWSNGGVQPDEVEMIFTKTAFEAARAFATQKDIAAVVSWAPDIYRIAEKLPGNELLVTTAQANHLSADVWWARADFARDNPEIIEGIVRGILDATTTLKDDAAKQQAAKWMSDGFGIPADETLGMLGDAHWTNYAENREFFINQNNPTNFERTYNTAFLLYKAVGALSQKVDFDQIMDFSVIKKLGADEKYAKQRNEYEVTFAPVAASQIPVESTILTKTVVVQFFPNSADLYKKVEKRGANGEATEGLYDPNVDFVVEEIAKVSKQYGAARILIQGHTDASMKGQADPGLVKKLSEDRANAVKEAIIKKFQLPPNQFTVEGKGWDAPADPNDPGNHAKNRRVEVRVVPAEAH